MTFGFSSDMNRAWKSTLLSLEQQKAEQIENQQLFMN